MYALHAELSSGSNGEEAVSDVERRPDSNAEGQGLPPSRAALLGRAELARAEAQACLSNSESLTLAVLTVTLGCGNVCSRRFRSAT